MGDQFPAVIVIIIIIIIIVVIIITIIIIENVGYEMRNKGSYNN